MTLSQVHDTYLCCGQQLCEILSISVKGLRSYGPDKVDGQTDGVMDRPTGRFLYTPQTVFAGCI